MSQPKPKHPHYTKARAEITEAGHRLGIAADELAQDDKAHALLPFLRKHSLAFIELARTLHPPDPPPLHVPTDTDTPK